MIPTTRTNERGRFHSGACLAGIALAICAGGLLLPAAASTAEAVAPRNTAEPVVSGRSEQNRTLSASRGVWTGTGPISYAYRWVRCGTGGGLPDGSDCAAISGATASSYRTTASDVGARLRVRVTATNADGSATVASNPTATIVGPPVLVRQPLVGGALLNGTVATADPGIWSGRQPITFSYRWLRCNTAGGDCIAIPGGTGRTYRLTSADVGHKMRFNVTAQNTVGSLTAISGESAVVSEPLPAGAVRLPSGEISIPATSVPASHRLVVSEVRFSPSRIASRRQAITVRIKVRDTRAYVVRDAFVFVRSTPKVTTGGDRRLTAPDGWITYELVPLASFPTRARTAVQFFVKAYRGGDPPLGGVYGSRLVQVPVRLG
jgi:hypothetical protein